MNKEINLSLWCGWGYVVAGFKYGVIQDRVARQRPSRFTAQRDRQSASLVQLSPDALTSQIGCQILPCNPHVLG